MRTAWRRELASRAKLSFLPLLLACTLAFVWAPSARAESTAKTVVMVVDPSALPLALRYAVYVHAGKPEPGELDRRWEAFSKTPSLQPVTKK